MPASGDRICLDTSAYSALRRGDETAIDALAAATVILVPVVVLGELEAGFRAGARYASNAAELRSFLERPDIVVVPAEVATAIEYGRLFGALRAAGTPIGTNDLWIAAVARLSGARLLTADRDFERISGLDLVRIPARRG